ncbi:hypothetical protein HW130_32710 [Streptomyces sp. PKU-EA00015]|nr:hypothetical protein [Streptomyces sp. PKU-EA00015]NWF30950.1 hypothetical protein [Streptomyces sp. PKU-EA00015]
MPDWSIRRCKTNLAVHAIAPAPLLVPTWKILMDWGVLLLHLPDDI